MFMLTNVSAHPRDRPQDLFIDRPSLFRHGKTRFGMQTDSQHRKSDGSPSLLCKLPGTTFDAGKRGPSGSGICPVSGANP